MAEPDVVLQLKATPFDSLTFEEKRLIIKNGRPRPPLKNLTSKITEKNRSYIRHFMVSNYECYDWLCGSETLVKLFCWPCILFGKYSKVIWVSNGFYSLSTFTKSARAHQSSESHLKCVLDLHNFSKQTADEGIDRSLKISDSVHCQKVKKNREVLKRLIDVTCFLAKQELPFRGHDETETSLDTGNYVETLNLLKIWDPVFAAYCETDTVFKDTSSDTQNDLISVIGEVVSEYILKEIEETDFVAVILDESSDVKSKSQLSTVLRYVVKGEECIKERFIGFSDVSADRSADGLLLHVKDTVNKFKFTNKFVAQSCDGTAVPSSQLSDLQDKVLDQYPNALYVHCYAHLLNLVLAQGTNEISECNIFFSTLKGIATFSSRSGERSFSVQDHLEKSTPSFTPTKWCFTSRLVNTVENYRKSIIEFFSSIYESPDDDIWTGPDRCAAYGYVEFLKKFETMFLLNLFSPLFAESHVLSRILLTKNLDIPACLNYIRDFQQLLKNKRQGFKHCEECKRKLTGGRPTISSADKCDDCETDGFNLLWRKTVSMVAGPLHTTETRQDNACDTPPPEQRFRRLFFAIIDNLTDHLTERFSSFEDLAFFELLNPKKFKKFSHRYNFPEALINNLGKTYPNVFDLYGLRSELNVLYRTTTFHDNPPHMLIKLLKDENLHGSFKETFRLAKLISTIPAATAAVDQRFSALKRVHRYKRSTQREEPVSSLALLSIEKDLLSSLKEKEDFYDTVIQKFAWKTGRLDFTFKPPFEMVECGEDPTIGNEQSDRRPSILESILEKPKTMNRTSTNRTPAADKKRKRKDDKETQANGEAATTSTDKLSSVDVAKLKNEMQEVLNKKVRVDPPVNDADANGASCSSSSDPFAEVLIKEEVSLFDVPAVTNVFADEPELPVVEIKKELTFLEESNPLDTDNMN